MQIIFLKELRLIGEHGLYQADGNLRGLLHHIAKLSGDIQLPFTLREHALDIEDFSAYRGPGKAGNNSRLSFFLYFSSMQRVHVQIFSKVSLSYGNLLSLPLNKMDRRNAA